MRSTLCARRGSFVAAVFAAVAGLSFTGSAAQASLTLDLRSTDSANPKLVFPPVGTTAFVLHFDLYGVVTGKDANLTNEGLQDTFFSILSTNTTPPGLKGNLAISLVAPFNGPGSDPGTVQDLDGDGDLDIGSNDPNNPNGWVFARAFPIQTGQSEYLLAHVTFTPTAPFVAGETDAAVGLRVTASPSVFSALWQEDGQERDSNGVSTANGQYLAGAPVILAVPEPASLSILAAPALALAARRRRSR
jgi:hypothetical protein